MKRYSSLSEVIPTDLGNMLSGLPFLDFLYDGGDYYHVVQSGEDHRIDLIAYKYLKNPRLWPLIAWHNNLGDVLAEVTTGRELRIPVDPVSLINNIFAFTYR